MSKPIHHKAADHVADGIVNLFGSILGIQPKPKPKAKKKGGKKR